MPHSLIKNYIESEVASKREDLQQLHEAILHLNPDAKLWFLDGKNEDGKMVSNPNIGYGESLIHYKNGDSKLFYRVGLSANTSGISVYIFGHADKKHLNNLYASRLGKANVSGYCIKFKSLKDIQIDVLLEAISEAFHLPL